MVINDPHHHFQLSRAGWSLGFCLPLLHNIPRCQVNNYYWYPTLPKHSSKHPLCCALGGDCFNLLTIHHRFCIKHLKHTLEHRLLDEWKFYYRSPSHRAEKNSKLDQYLPGDQTKPQRDASAYVVVYL